LSDIFQEVDEEVRREQLKKLWDRYGSYVVAAAILVVAGIAAWRGYQWWEAQKAAEAGAAFEMASTLADAGKHADAETAFAKVVTDGTSAYRHLARLREAAELARIDAKAAIALYDKIAADWSRSPPTIAPSVIPRANCWCSPPGAPATRRAPSAGST
jgi:hypothetical protein